MEYPEVKENCEKILEAKKFAESKGYQLVFTVNAPKHIGGVGTMILTLYKYSPHRPHRYCYKAEAFTSVNFDWFVDGVYKYINEHLND